ncbi:MAG: septum formation initiator family protein [Nitrospinae bacterium]|nr:septum formation initiator family protein [Nitrospinota bacterium]
MMDRKPWFLFAVSVVYFLLVTIAARYKENGFNDINRLSTAIAEVREKITGVTEENGLYVKELAQITASDEYVEAIARESLGVVKPGEVVYEFVDIEKIAGHQPVNETAGEPSE